MMARTCSPPSQWIERPPARDISECFDQGHSAAPAVSGRTQTVTQDCRHIVISVSVLIKATQRLQLSLVEHKLSHRTVDTL
ncbi:hypothetical protein RRG08_022653 [Elysia crispata]|uniref:Uncharacterized protein n=1 Tax=Elysia crispata TaxID=231223 RepID=A0AAE0Z1U1_9GAST|nr:hypothetical protein RRG08_022653 [Elysia crispata]